MKSKSGGRKHNKGDGRKGDGRSVGAERRAPNIQNAGPRMSGPSTELGNQSTQMSLRAAPSVTPVLLGHPEDPAEGLARQTADSIVGTPPAGIVSSRPSNDSPPRTSQIFNGRAGRPLEPGLRAFFEHRLSAPLGGVRLHDDPATAAQAQTIGAKAFAAGDHIGFAPGKFRPDTAPGLKLLAHELAHTLQQHGDSKPIIQADFQSDFAGRQDVPVEGTSVQPRGTIQVKAPNGTWVYAPFGIYRPADVPTEFQDRIMESGKAFQWRNPDLQIGEALKIELERKENAGELTVGDMKTLAEGAGSSMNIRIMMARVGSDYRFVGYDMSLQSTGTRTSPVVYEGFVESERTETRGVGAALFADRIVRALSEGASMMDLEVYTSADTARFHAEIWRVIGRPGTPTERQHYQLSTRQMIRIALTWSDALSAQQRLDLVRLASQENEPTPAEAQAILAVSGAGSGTPGAEGGFAPETLAAMRGLASQVNANIRKVAELERYEQLSDPDTVDRLIQENGGYAVVGGRLYKVVREGGGTNYFEIKPLEIKQKISPSSGEAREQPPGPGAQKPNEPPSKGEPPAKELPIEPVKEGDVIIVPFTTFIKAVDAKTGRTFFGLYEGERWYRLESATAAKRLEFDPVTGEQLVPTTLTTSTGAPLLARRWDPEATGPAPTGAPGGVAGGVVAAGGIIMVLNELLGPFGAALAQQRANIAKGRAEISFWIALGANPQTGVWDTIDRKPAPPDAKPDTAVFGHPLVPYVIDIDAERLRPNIALRTANYQELQSLLSVGKRLGAIREQDGRFFAVASVPDREHQKVYDITEAVTQTTTQVLSAADAALRARTAALPASQVSNKLYRMNRGAVIYRSERGGQVIRNSAEQMGTDPMVREVTRRTSNILEYLKTGYHGTRVQVMPVNADAYRGAAYATYVVYENIEDAWKEVRAAGRSVLPDKLPGVLDDALTSFVAGSGHGATTDFGSTTYTVDPYDPGHQTLATGELASFWVSDSDLTPLDEAQQAAALGR